MKFKKGDRVLDRMAGRGGVIKGFSSDGNPVFRWGDFDWDTHSSRLVPWTGPIPSAGCVIHGKPEDCKCGKGKRVTYTISKLSGKAIRLVARYLAIVKMGGTLEDTPETFYSRALRDRPGAARVEVERQFGILTDEFEEKLRDEEGFIGDHYDVVSFVQGRLGDGFLRDGEVAADNRSNGLKPLHIPRRLQTAPRASRDPKDISRVLKQLKECKDPKEARLLRRTLRRMGHRGGLKG